MLLRPQQGEGRAIMGLEGTQDPLHMLSATNSPETCTILHLAKPSVLGAFHDFHSCHGSRGVHIPGFYWEGVRPAGRDGLGPTPQWGFWSALRGQCTVFQQCRALIEGLRCLNPCPYSRPTYRSPSPSHTRNQLLLAPDLRVTIPCMPCLLPGPPASPWLPVPADPR